MVKQNKNEEEPIIHLRNLDKTVLEKAFHSLPYFTFSIYRNAVEEHFGDWIGGDYLIHRASIMQDYPKTMYLGARDHWKSMGFYCKNMWHLYRHRWIKQLDRNLYFGYKKTLAEEHLYEMKQLIEASILPALGLKDNNPNAHSTINYSYQGQKAEFRIKAKGFLEGTRGGHANRVYVDDPYIDPANPDSPVAVWKINNLFGTVVMNMPLPTVGELHVIGTPQSKDDIFFDENLRKEFQTFIEPAIYFKTVDDVRVEAARWPEKYSLALLKSMQESRKVKMRGGSVALFDQEFMCQPRSNVSSYFDRKNIDDAINDKLLNYDFEKEALRFKPYGRYVIAGYDPGKKVHPGHLWVGEIKYGRYIQILSKWFDHRDYSVDKNGELSQFNYINRAIEIFGIRKTFGDNTHGELTTADENDFIPGLVCMNITASLKQQMASAIESALIDKRLMLVPDERQASQLMQVQKDLNIIETSEGHGEPFTSIGLPLSQLALGIKKPAKKGLHLVVAH